MICMYCVSIYLYVVIFLDVPIYLCTNIDGVELQKCIIFGPGIENIDFNLPVRYFYVQLVDGTGRNLTKPPVENFLSVNRFKSEKDCAAHYQILDVHDGSYIVRYIVYGRCDEIKIEITAGGDERHHVAMSPYVLHGSFNHDRCVCPQPLEFFYKNIGCPDKYDQMEEDLNHWPLNSIDFLDILESAESRFGTHPYAYSFCHYTILKNELYRKCYGQYVGFNMFSDAILLSILRKVQLPDMELLFNLGDWPLESKGGKVPFFSWCSSVLSQDIVVPTYEMTEATLQMMGGQSMDIFSALSTVTPDWSSKIDRAIWRGRDSSQERLILVKLSRQHPHLIEAGITRFFFYKDLMHLYGPELPNLPFEKFFDYKYVITLDGTVAAYRFPYLLAGDSLVLKQDSNYYEFFYNKLQPWVHYVPIDVSISDVVERVEWAKDHQEEARNITRNARKFVRENLFPAEIFCYYTKALQKFASKLKSAPENVPLGAERVPQPGHHECDCKTSQLHAQDREEL